jgi:hypothetical protein
VIVALAVPGTGRAHHEAIFGPHSSLILSAPGYVSFQSYSRQLGTPDARTQETNLLLSAGLTPIARIPLSFTLIAPASEISVLDGQGASRRGLEDVVLGARYRYDLEGDGNFLMGMLAVEVPVGSIDHPAFEGPLDEMAALLASIERGPISGIGYAFYRRHGRDAGVRAGDNLFVGGGGAFTPWDDPATERLLSFQLGVSYERYLRDDTNGVTDPMTGGRGLYVHPTFVWGPGGHVLLFALATLPLAQDYASAADQDRWRVGAGLVYLFGH